MSHGEVANHPTGIMRHTRRITGGGLLPGGPRGIFPPIGGDTGAGSIDPTTTACTLRIMEGSVTVPTVVAAEAEGTGRRVAGVEVVRSTEFSSRILGLTGSRSCRVTQSSCGS